VVRDAGRNYTKVKALSKEIAQRSAELNSRGYQTWVKVSARPLAHPSCVTFQAAGEVEGGERNEATDCSYLLARHVGARDGRFCEVRAGAFGVGGAAGREMLAHRLDSPRV
jgi:hypothetical protein